MDNEESSAISAKTWSRRLEPIAKAGYMEGAADGQSSVFQSSFDLGFKQGFSFGVDLGKLDATFCIEKQTHSEELQRGLKRINCQICMNSTVPQQSVVNLYNIQKEKNEDFLCSFNKDQLS